MKLTIETENPAEIAQIVAALSGSAPAAHAPPKVKAEKKETPAAPEQPAAVESVAASVPAPVQPEPPPAPAAPTSDYVPDEAALTTAANSAIAKLGAGAQAKVKEYIAATFQKDDGSPAGLRTVRADQRARLLADLNAFAAGKKVI
jgi:hypothetical protein